MRKMVAAVLAATAMAASIFMFPTVEANAEEMKMVGVVTEIGISGKDATSATVTLKDNKTEKLVTIRIEDELTLDKFKDHRIVEGDEIRCKYDSKDGHNVSTYFRKTAGC